MGGGWVCGIRGIRWGEMDPILDIFGSYHAPNISGGIHRVQMGVIMGPGRSGVIQGYPWGPIWGILTLSLYARARTMIVSNIPFY